MGFSDTVKDSIVVVVAGAFAAGAGLGWAVAEKIRVEPKNEEIARLEKTVASSTSGEARIRDLEARNAELLRKLAAANGREYTPTTDPPKPEDTGSAAGSGEIKSAQGFDFALEGCTPEGSDLDCWLRVTNRRARRPLSISADSRLVDQNGNPHRKKFILEGGGGRRRTGTTLDLAKDVPTRFGFRFEGLGGYVTAVTLLDVQGVQCRVARCGDKMTHERRRPQNLRLQSDA